MALDTSEDEYIDSDHTSQSGDANSEGYGRPDHAQGSKTHQDSHHSPDYVSSLGRSASPSGTSIEHSHAGVDFSQGRPGENSRSRRSSERGRRSGHSSTTQSRPPSRQRSRPWERGVKLDGTLTTAYRDLLNGMIADVSGQAAVPDLMSASQIGASFWSSREKTALFQALELHGECNLPRLSLAVRTKNQYEIQVYLSLLRESLTTPSSSSPYNTLQLIEFPAASEISLGCEAALNVAADMLSSRVEMNEQLAERTKLNDSWLITAETAEEEDQKYKEGLAAETEVADDLPTGDGDTASSDRANLLRPAAFLELSRNLFMNNDEQDALNWNYVDLITDVSNEPAMFRRAFQDFHDITLGLTRRLVQVSIFQAMTRLRANDSSRADWTPSVTVREVDVRSAAELLSMGPEWKHYWATAARRCRVTAYSGSKKYNDGRGGAKSGYGLTYDEVEAELGMKRPGAGAEAEDGRFEVLEEHIDKVMADSDAFTDEHDETNSHGHCESESESESGPRGSSSTILGNARKRKRPLSPDSVARAENEYCEAADGKASAQEQIRLWKLLRQMPPDSLVAASMTTSRPITAQNLVHIDPGPLSWRQPTSYEAEWEQNSGQPQLADFQSTTIRGLRGRQRRSSLEAKVNERLHPRAENRLASTNNIADLRQCEEEHSEGGSVCVAEDDEYAEEGSVSAAEDDGQEEIGGGSETG